MFAVEILRGKIREGFFIKRRRLMYSKKEKLKLLFRGVGEKRREEKGKEGKGRKEKGREEKGRKGKIKEEIEEKREK